MRTIHFAGGLIGLACLSACTERDNTEQAYGCLVESTEPVTDLTATPDGFTLSAQEAIDATEGVFAGTAIRTDSAEEALELAVARDGAVVVERRAWQDGGTDLAHAGDCFDNFAFPALYSLMSGDSLDEAADGVVRYTTEAVGSLGFELPLEDLHGDAVPFGFDPAEMTRTALYVYATTVATGWTGEITFVGELIEDGPDGSASATLDPWASFSASRPAE